MDREAQGRDKSEFKISIVICEGAYPTPLHDLEYHIEKH